MRGLTLAFRTLTCAMCLGVRNWVDAFLLCMKKHFIFQASAVPSPGQGQIFFLLYQHEAASKVSCLSEGNVILKRKLRFVGCCWRNHICPQQIFMVLLLFTKQKEGNMKRTEGTLHFTEDSKNCTGSCKTLITSYRLQSCSFYLINESKQKSNMWQTNHEVKASLTYHSERTIIKVLWSANRRDIFSLIIEEDAYKSQKLLKF